MHWSSVFGANPVDIKNSAGDVVSSSKNLRGIRAYASRPGIWIEEVHISRRPDFGGHLHVVYGPNRGATADANFASFTVMQDWVARWRNAKGATLFVDGINRGVVDPRNPGLTADY